MKVSDGIKAGYEKDKNDLLNSIVGSCPSTPEEEIAMKKTGENKTDRIVVRHTSRAVAAAALALVVLGTAYGAGVLGKNELETAPMTSMTESVQEDSGVSGRSFSEIADDADRIYDVKVTGFETVEGGEFDGMIRVTGETTRLYKAESGFYEGEVTFYGTRDVLGDMAVSDDLLVALKARHSQDPTASWQVYAAYEDMVYRYARDGVGVYLENLSGSSEDRVDGGSVMDWIIEGTAGENIVDCKKWLNSHSFSCDLIPEKSSEPEGVVLSITRNGTDGKGYTLVVRYSYNEPTFEYGDEKYSQYENRFYPDVVRELSADGSRVVRREQFSDTVQPYQVIGVAYSETEGYTVYVSAGQVPGQLVDDMPDLNGKTEMEAYMAIGEAFSNIDGYTPVVHRHYYLTDDQELNRVVTAFHTSEGTKMDSTDGSQQEIDIHLEIGIYSYSGFSDTELYESNLELMTKYFELTDLSADSWEVRTESLPSLKTVLTVNDGSTMAAESMDGFEGWDIRVVGTSAKADEDMMKVYFAVTPPAGVQLTEKTQPGGLDPEEVGYLSYAESCFNEGDTKLIDGTLVFALTLEGRYDETDTISSRFIPCVEFDSIFEELQVENGTTFDIKVEGTYQSMILM